MSQAPPLAVPLTDLAALPFSPTGNQVTVGRVVTIRMPADLHAALLDQAHYHRTSLNALCLSRLMAAVPQCPLFPAGPPAARAQFVTARTRYVAEAQGGKGASHAG
jgi:hypothetical protein